MKPRKKKKDPKGIESDPNADRFFTHDGDLVPVGPPVAGETLARVIWRKYHLTPEELWDLLNKQPPDTEE